MFNQVVSGKKDMTRRVSYLPFFLDCENHTNEQYKKTKFFGKPTEYVVSETKISCKHCGQIGVFEVKPRYNVGEIIYIKEPYMVVSSERIDGGCIVCVEYKYKYGRRIINLKDNYKGAMNRWISPRYMPEWAARYFVEIIHVGAGKIQDISEEDCIREGVEYVIPRLKAKSIKKTMPKFPLGYSTEIHYKDYTFLKSKKRDLKPLYKFINPKDSFITLWNLINGKENPFHNNSYVFIYEFKLKKINESKK